MNKPEWQQLMERGSPYSAEELRTLWDRPGMSRVNDKAWRCDTCGTVKRLDSPEALTPQSDWTQAVGQVRTVLELTRRALLTEDAEEARRIMEQMDLLAGEEDEDDTDYYYGTE